MAKQANNNSIIIPLPRALPQAARKKVEAAIDCHLSAVQALTAFLDEADVDSDLEPSLAGTGGDDREYDPADPPKTEGIDDNELDGAGGSAMKSATLGQLVKDHQKANGRVDYFCKLKGETTEAQQEASIDALKALNRTWSAVCRFKARDADELLKWLAYVLADDEVTGKSIRVMDGIAALKAAHGALCEHLLPADPFHTR